MEIDIEEVYKETKKGRKRNCILKTIFGIVVISTAVGYCYYIKTAIDLAIEASEVVS